MQIRLLTSQNPTANPFDVANNFKLTFAQLEQEKASSASFNTLFNGLLLYILDYREKNSQPPHPTLFTECERLAEAYLLLRNRYLHHLVVMKILSESFTKNKWLQEKLNTYLSLQGNLQWHVFVGMIAGVKFTGTESHSEVVYLLRKQHYLRDIEQIYAPPAKELAHVIYNELIRHGLFADENYLQELYLAIKKLFLIKKSNSVNNLVTLVDDIGGLVFQLKNPRIEINLLTKIISKYCNKYHSENLQVPSFAARRIQPNDATTRTAALASVGDIPTADPIELSAFCLAVRKGDLVALEKIKTETSDRWLLTLAAQDPSPISLTWLRNTYPTLVTTELNSLDDSGAPRYLRILNNCSPSVARYILFWCNVKLNFKSSSYSSIVALAIASEMTHALKRLSEHDPSWFSNLLENSSQGGGPLLSTCRSNSHTFVYLVTEHPKCIRWRRHNDPLYTIFHYYAPMSVSAEAINLLKTADPIYFRHVINFLNAKHQTACELAIEFYSIKTFKALIKGNTQFIDSFNPPWRTSKNSTLLIDAVFVDREELLRVMAEEAPEYVRVAVNLEVNGVSPLAAALKYNSASVIPILIELGADIGWKNSVAPHWDLALTGIVEGKRDALDTLQQVAPDAINRYQHPHAHIAYLSDQLSLVTSSMSRWIVTHNFHCDMTAANTYLIAKMKHESYHFNPTTFEANMNFLLWIADRSNYRDLPIIQFCRKLARNYAISPESRPYPAEKDFYAYFSSENLFVDYTKNNYNWLEFVAKSVGLALDENSTGADIRMRLAVFAEKKVVATISTSVLAVFSNDNDPSLRGALFATKQPRL